MLLHSKTLKKFSQIKSFKTKDVTGKKVCFPSKYKNVNVLIIMCNHCPYVVRVLPQLLRVLDELKEDIHAVLLNPNDSKAYPEDSPAKMLEWVELQEVYWPYVYDEHQTIAKQYQAVCTPEIFVYSDNKLHYHGAFDQTSYEENPSGILLKKAIKLAMQNECMDEWPPSMGCSIKWS